MNFQVPVETVGIAIGVKNQGGILDMVLREIEVECLPTDVPDQIKIDISGLNIGDSFRVSGIDVDQEKVSLLTGPESVIITVSAPRVEEEVEVVEEGEIIAEVTPEEVDVPESGGEDE